MPIKIIFMGTPEFSLPTLDLLLKKKYEIVCVYTQPPKKSNRGQKIHFSPVQNFSMAKGLLVRNPDNLNNNKEYDFIKNLNADLAIVVAYGKLIPKKFLNITKFGFFNIHASLLPKWRGAAPIQRAIMNREKKTGISLMKIEEGLDTGPIISSTEFKIDFNTTYGTAKEKLSEIGANLILKNLLAITNNQVTFFKQKNTEATYAKKINKEEGRIDWSMDAEQIIAIINGLNPNPGAWFKFRNTRYKLYKAKLIKYNKIKPGTIIDDKLTVMCGKNALSILEIQKEGKNRQKINEFILGSIFKKNLNLNNENN